MPERTTSAQGSEIDLAQEVPEQLEKKTLSLVTDVQQIGDCERRVKVTVSGSDVEGYFQNEFSELEKTAYVPGFRIGKAPRKLVERRFRKESVERVKHLLVMDALEQVNSSSDFTPISEPDLDIAGLVLPENGDFVFEFTVEVRPDFDMPEWKGLQIEKPVREFSKDDIDVAVQKVLSQYSGLEPSDEPARLGDYIDVDIKVKSGGDILNAVEGQTVKVCPALTFHDGTIAGFDKLALNAKSGDTITVDLTISADAPNEACRGKTVSVVFEVLGVQRETFPAVTESFIQRVGFENEGDFRDAVLDSLNRQLEFEQHRRTRRQITEKLTVAATWELPPALLRRQSEREFRRTVMELQRSGYERDEILAQLNAIRQNSATTTAQALKEHFILEKIAEIENIVDTPEDYDVEVALIAAQSKTTPRKIRAQIEKAGEMDILRNQIIERKVIQLISKNAVFKEVSFEWESRSAVENVDALDWAVAGDPSAIEEASKDDLKAVHQEIDEKRRVDPNVKVK